MPPPADWLALAGWQAIAAGGLDLRITQAVGPSGPALRLDFDLGNGGFVIARRDCDLALPEDFAFQLQRRGHGVLDAFEFKLIDDVLGNVWRFLEPDAAAPSTWSSLQVRAIDLAYAWGAHETNRIEHADHLEIALVGRGRGQLELASLQLEARSTGANARVLASTCAAGSDPQAVLVDGAGWRSAEGETQWLEIHFGDLHAFSAVLLHWAGEATPLAFGLELATAPGDWVGVHECARIDGAVSPVLLPGAQATALRLRLRGPVTGCGVRRIEVQPWHFARSFKAGLSSLARTAPRGHFPRSLQGEQAYWTVVGAPTGGPPALINTDGLLEPGHADFGLEGFVRVGQRLFSWADVTSTPALVEEGLPLPCVRWQGEGFSLHIAPCVPPGADAGSLHVDYRLENTGTAPLALTLYLVVRPFLVTPPWQQPGARAGFSDLPWVEAERTRLLTPRSALSPAPPAELAFSCHASALPALLGAPQPAGHPRTEAGDGMASGVLGFERVLAPGARCSVRLQIHGATTGTPLVQHANPLAASGAAWREGLGGFRLELPAGAGPLWPTLRAAAAHILINRNGPRLQPGPRRYTRAWLRDGVGMGTALARFGLHAPLREFLAWYAGFQREDGEFPSCIDDTGAEWLPEFDAFGEFLHGVALSQRLAPDAHFCSRLWPHALRALARLTALRERRLGPDFDTPALSARRGLLPESMSHEGYMAQPVHAYWDDFWALRGLRDLAWLAAGLGHATRAAEVSQLAADFRRDLIASIHATLAHHGIDFLPGAVELGDFDPTASAIAITLAELGDALPPAVVHRTFDRYLAGLAARQQDTHWQHYSAYEIRIVGALVRLGRRRDALHVLRTLLDDTRPPAWRQWPEQSWRVMDAPAFLGDLPHSWIGAEFIHSALSLFAYSEDAGPRLVLAAGLALDWLAPSLAVHGLHTDFGVLDYRVIRTGAWRIEMHIDAGLHLPAGGLLLCPPLPGPLRGIMINGRPAAALSGDTCACHALPAHVVFDCEDTPHD